MLQKAPFSGCSEAALVCPTIRTPPVNPKPAFQTDTNQKALLREAECWEMRLSVQTDRPSIFQRPLYLDLTACESAERKGLAGRIVIQGR